MFLTEASQTDQLSAPKPSTFYTCVLCHQPLEPTTETSLALPVSCCDVQYYIQGDRLKYEYEKLLLNRFKEKYLLNRVLNNNGFIAYYFDTKRNFSVGDRQDVKLFRKFIERLLPTGRVLDIGCGFLEVPGYVDFENKSAYEVYGLDPIEDYQFRGPRAVGCSEYMPYPNEYFDAAIYGTSLDHTCCPETSFEETNRILKPGGFVFIWMGDVSKTWWQKIKLWYARKKESRRLGYNVDRFRVWGPEGNNLVFYIPEGAVDPFHSYFECPKTTGKLMRGKGFVEHEVTEYVPTGYFLAYKKA